MTRLVRQLLLPLGTTLALVFVLLGWDPFRYTSDLTAQLAGPVRQDAMVSNLYRNPVTQELTNGAAPLQSLNRLASVWCKTTSSAQKFILVGNSQTYTMLLAPSEPASHDVERVYLDQLLEREAFHGQSILGYRLAAPNLSYPEVLWYLQFLLTRSCLKPDRMIVQLNYESFRKMGIRDGMLELLADSSFAARINDEAQSRSDYAATFRQALDRYADLTARTHRGPAATATTITDVSRTGILRGFSVGSYFETEVRKLLEKSDVFRRRQGLKSELLTTLYLLRVNVLGITPTTKRSLGGAALAISVSALDRVGALCDQSHIKLEFFLAPQNPRASLYRTERDHLEYRRITDRLIHSYAWRSADLERVIPASEWGIWIDGPDPIHFGRAAHARMAQDMIASGLIPDGS